LISAIGKVGWNGVGLGSARLGGWLRWRKGGEGLYGGVWGLGFGSDVGVGGVGEICGVFRCGGVSWVCPGI